MELAIGVVLGAFLALICCHGHLGTSEIVRWMRTCLASLRMIWSPSLTMVTAGVVLSVLIAFVLALQGTRVPPAQLPMQFRVAAFTLFVCGLAQEGATMHHLTSAAQAKAARFGTKQALLMGLESYPSQSSILASYVMAGVYVILLMTYAAMFTLDIGWCHLDPVAMRPVSTLRYVEWSFAVPLLLWISGRLHLQNPPEAVLVPILQTVAYIWLCWAAQLCHGMLARSFLVSAGFTVWVESAMRMLCWVRTSQWESKLLLFTNIAFAGYGVVYLLAIANAITATTEEFLYTVGDVTVKATFTNAMAVSLRNEQLKQFYSAVSTYLDLMVGMRALVGSQFDFVINCTISSTGLIVAESNAMLSHYTGRDLKGRSLEDICLSEEDREQLRRLQRNLNGKDRQRETPNATPWQRQEAMFHMPHLVRIDMLWQSSARGTMSAELFIASPTVGGAIGDDVLIGVRIGEGEDQLFQEPPTIRNSAAIDNEDAASNRCSDSTDDETVISRHQCAKQSVPVPVHQTNGGYEQVGAQQAPATIRRSDAQVLLDAAHVVRPSNKVDANPRVSAAEASLRVLKDEAAAESSHRELKEAAAKVEKEREAKVAAIQQLREAALQEMYDAKVAAEKAASAVALQEQELSKIQVAQKQNALEAASKAIVDSQAATIAPAGKQASSANSKPPSALEQSPLTASNLEESTKALQRDFGPASGIASPPALRSRNPRRGPRSVTSSYSKSSVMLPPVVEVDTPSASVSASGAPSEPSSSTAGHKPLQPDVEGTAETKKVSSQEAHDAMIKDEVEKAFMANQGKLNGGRHKADLDDAIFDGPFQDDGIFDGAMTPCSTTTAMTYRTTAATMVPVRAQGRLVNGSGQLNSLSFTVPTDCREYQSRIEADSGHWNWDPLLIEADEVEQGEHLGQGSFAKVFAAKWRGVVYAQKVLLRTAFFNRRHGYPSAVRREVSILADLAHDNHPHLCQLVGIVVTSSKPLSLLFELCAAGSLFRHLQDETKVPTWQAKLALFTQVASALSYLHQRQIVHRDLKSNNVLLMSELTRADLEGDGLIVKPNLQAKLADVGLARWVAFDEKDSLPLSATPLPTGGSFDWRAPEMTTGHYGLSVDIYAFGILMLEAGTWVPHLPATWRQALGACNEGISCSVNGGPVSQAHFAYVVSQCLTSDALRPKAAAVLLSCRALDANGCIHFQERWRQSI